MSKTDLKFEILTSILITHVDNKENISTNMKITYLYLWSIYHHYDLRQIWLICSYKIIKISKEELNYPEMYKHWCNTSRSRIQLDAQKFSFFIISNKFLHQISNLF